MPPNTDIRYMVRARDDNGALAEFARSVAGDPDIALVDQIGPQGKAHTLVIAVPQDKAASIEERFRNSTQLTLERDRPLSLF